MASKIGLFFGSSTGCGEGVANLIKQIIEGAGKAEVEVQVVSADSVKVMENYELLIFGASTWNIGELQDEKVVAKGGSIVAWWPDGEYEYEFSRGAFEKTFMGLPVDNDNQPEQTQQRVVNWTYWVMEEFGLMTAEEVVAAAA